MFLLYIYIYTSQIKNHIYIDTMYHVSYVFIFHHISCVAIVKRMGIINMGIWENYGKLNSIHWFLIIFQTKIAMLGL